MFSAIRINKKYDFLEKEYYEEYESVNVYAIRDDKNGYPHFLIYEYGEWKYVSAKHFKPED